MKKQTTNQATIHRNQKILISHYSDGSELIPSGITSDFQRNDNLVVGYTRDDEGVINNFPFSQLCMQQPIQLLNNNYATFL
ncbi:MAG: hypothetical protein WBA93_20225 [Microcoleaceae cyanobacterium]